MCPWIFLIASHHVVLDSWTDSSDELTFKSSLLYGHFCLRAFHDEVVWVFKHTIAVRVCCVWLMWEYIRFSLLVHVLHLTDAAYMYIRFFSLAYFNCRMCSGCKTFQISRHISIFLRDHSQLWLLLKNTQPFYNFSAEFHFLPQGLQIHWKTAYFMQNYTLW